MTSSCTKRSHISCLSGIVMKFVSSWKQIITNDIPICQDDMENFVVEIDIISLTFMHWR